MMLKNTAGSSVTAKRLQPLLLLLVLGAGYAAWAQQPVQQSSAQQESDASVVKDNSAAGDRDATVNREQAAPPRYPQHALQQAQSGKVVALVDVDAQGHATGVQIESSSPAGVFDQSVRDAVGKWQFEPARKHGEPVPGQLRVPVTFDSAMTAVAAPAGQGSLNWYQVDWGNSIPEGVCTQVATDAGGHTLCGIAKSTRQ